MNDQGLMKRLEARDNKAWSKAFPVLRKDIMFILQKHHHLRLFEDDASDICQEVLVEVVGKFPFSSSKTLDDLRFFPEGSLYEGGLIMFVQSSQRKEVPERYVAWMQK